MQRSKQLAAMFLLGAFLVGGTLGFTVDRVVGHRLVSSDSTASMLDEFSEELDLTASQRAAVDSILDERHRIVDSILQPLRPSLRAVRDSARHQIARRLTPTQRVKFQQYVERQSKH